MVVMWWISSRSPAADHASSSVDVKKKYDESFHEELLWFHIQERHMEFSRRPALVTFELLLKEPVVLATLQLLMVLTLCSLIPLFLRTGRAV